MTKIKLNLVKGGFITRFSLPFLYGSTLFQPPLEINVPSSTRVAREPTFYNDNDDANHSSTEIKNHAPFPNSVPKAHDLNFEQLNCNRSDESLKVFDVTNYFNQEEYLKKKVELLLENEILFDFKVRLYKSSSVLCFWASGLTLGASTIISILSSAQIIESHKGNVITACFSAGSSVFLWAGGQFKKSAYKYEDASKKIKIALLVPKQLISPSINIEIEQPKFGVNGGIVSPSNKSLSKSAR